jgi:hypothetical protein
MARFLVQTSDVLTVEAFLAVYPDLHHLRVRRRGDLLTLESGPTENPRRHTRLRRVSVHLWRLEMPAASNRWNLTPFRDQLKVLLDLLVYQFPWTLAP